MGNQLASGAEALRMFFTDDIYVVQDDANIPVSVVPPAVAPVPEPVKEVSAPLEFKYLGKNQKNVLILVNDIQNEVSSEKGKELLKNIVKALQLTGNDFALLNYASFENSSFASLTAFFSSKLVLSFGVTGTQLGLSTQPDHVIINQGAVQLVFSQNLDLLAENPDGKKTLWGSLKQLQV